MNASSPIRWGRLAGALVLAEILLIGAAIAWVAIYSHALNPGQALAVYQAHAQASGPWVSISVGLPLFWALGRWLGWREGRVLLGLYLALDAALLLAFAPAAPPWLLVLLSYASKSAALWLGGRARP